MKARTPTDDPTPPPGFAYPAGERIRGKSAIQPNASKKIKVLLVTQSSGEVQLIGQLLAEADGAPFQLEWTAELEDGVKRVSAGDIAVVLLDLCLAPSDKVGAFLRFYYAGPGVPVVLLTSIEDEPIAVEAARRGASDYLVKGFTECNVLVRSLRFAIERQRRRRAEQDLDVSQENLRIGWETKKERFPASTPSIAGFDIAGVSHPAEITGGDYFDYINLVDGTLAVAIADVSGHGISPATRMAETRAYLRAFARIHTDPGEILAQVNAALFGDPLGPHFVTILLARLEPGGRSFQYFSAGHPTAFVCGAAGEVKSYLHSKTTPLGVLRHAEFPPAETVMLDPGDVVLLMTDGILEANAPDDTAFGHQRALKLLRDYREQPPAKIVEAIYQGARDFSEYGPQRDDMTAVVIKSQP
jgi:serine phosphatase RsbU (regulator of sigma subunit)